jgi:hypothetical protein
MKGGVLCVDMLRSHEVNAQVQAADAGSLQGLGQRPRRDREELDWVFAQVGAQERQGVQVTGAL